MPHQAVLLERDDAVAIVTLNRPDQHNALNHHAKDLLVDVLSDVAQDDTVRAVVLTGAGKSFCVGQDLGEHSAALEIDAGTAFATVDAHYSPVVRLLALMPKPVIAAINGACVGAGLGFALACDTRVISERARFGTAFTSIGLTCDSGLSSTLARSVGETRARELVLSAQPFSAVEAREWGIGGQVVDASQVVEVARNQARTFASGPTHAFAETKVLMARAFHRDWDDVLAAESAAQARCGKTVDHTSAVNAFLAKVQPQFIGR